VAVIHREPIVMVCTCEIAGRVRGKGFPARELPSRLTRGVGWVPTNTMISAFGPIYATPFGTTGDLILVPDREVEVNVDFGDDSAPEHFFLGDLKNLDGTFWECCPRDFLRRALAALQQAAGVTLRAAFEHEFVYTGADEMPGSAYSLDAYRRQGIFGEALVAALRLAGMETDSFLPEYGARQYEITCAPATGLRIADHAIILREMTRATAARLGHRATFAPILDPAGVGNGVHIHFSFLDANNLPSMHDPSAPLGLSKTAAQFVAGLLHHLPALCAITAPSTISYFRMRPNRWAPTHATLALQDRGVAVRIPPVIATGADAAKEFNVEYRPADAAASPYLALGAMVWAGVDGIRNAMELPDGDGPPLPDSLDAALVALEKTAAATGWFGVTYLNAYLMHKRAEARSLDGLDEAAQCARYAQTY
jgi:glutamine synthetase